MNNPLELYVQRKLITQRVIDLTTGADMPQIQENLRELESAIEKIEAKQPSKIDNAIISIRRYKNRFFHSQKQA